MSARKFVPAIPASQARTDAGPYLNPFAAYQRDLNARIADLGDKLRRWHADALADAIEAGDCDEDGEPVPYDTYRSAV